VIEILNKYFVVCFYIMDPIKEWKMEHIKKVNCNIDGDSCFWPKSFKSLK